MSVDLGGWEKILPSAALRVAEKNVFAISELVSGGVTIYPPEEDIFRAFEKTPPERCKVVILGQDPYHEAGQANGLAFSVNEGCKFPPSLRNIFKELHDDVGKEVPLSGDLSNWAEQGVLLLNTVLTVERGIANSHSSWDWQVFTGAVLEATRELPQPIGFILWGGSAQRIANGAGIAATAHPRLVVSSAHPSPLSAYRGFFGSKPFSVMNDWLLANGSEPIRW